MNTTKELDIKVLKEHNHLHIPIMYVISKNEEAERKRKEMIATIRNAVIVEKDDKYEIIPFYPRKGNKLDNANLYLHDDKKTIYLNGKEMEGICQRCPKAFGCIDKQIEPFSEECIYDVTSSDLYNEMRETYEAGDDIEYLEEIKANHPEWSEEECYAELDKVAFQKIKERLNAGSEQQFTDEEIENFMNGKVI